MLGGDGGRVVSAGGFHHLEGGLSEHVVLGVAEGLAGGNDDRVSRVHSEGIKVLPGETRRTQQM